jgi:hypothetical protein
MRIRDTEWSSKYRSRAITNNPVQHGEGTRIFNLVPKAGLEPARLAPHAPQTCVSAISPLRHLAGASKTPATAFSRRSNPQRTQSTPRAFARCGLVARLFEAPATRYAQTNCHGISCLRFTLHEQLATARGRRIIEVGQNPCQSREAPVESGRSCSPSPPTLRKIVTTSRLRSMMSLNDGHRGRSLRCSTSTTRSCLE